MKAEEALKMQKNKKKKKAKPDKNKLYYLL